VLIERRKTTELPLLSPQRTSSTLRVVLVVILLAAAGAAIAIYKLRLVS